MERIGIYGGTFNPPHIGHMAAARCAVDALRLDKLLLTPDRDALHKVMYLTNMCITLRPTRRLVQIEIIPIKLRIRFL